MPGRTPAEQWENILNNLNGWGILFAEDGAPFSVGGLSPAPVFVVLGIVLGQAFFMWTRRRMRHGKVPLVDLRVLARPSERSAVYAMFVIVSMEAAVNFSVPTYIQVVQGRTPFDTSLAMMPFNFTVFITATLIVRFYKRFSPRTIALFSFALTTVALVWLSFVVNNNWETVATIVGLIVFGIGQGALVTLVFNVLVTAAPKELAGDVGSLRGSTQNLASSYAADGLPDSGRDQPGRRAAGFAAAVVPAEGDTKRSVSLEPRRAARSGRSGRAARRSRSPRS